MKFVFLAAVALVATPALPALAQNTGSGSNATETMTPPIPVKEREVIGATPQTAPAPMAYPAPSAPATDPAMTTQGTMPGTTGGYQPSQPMPMASNGQRPVFVPGPSVQQAFPAPAPLESYPICRPGQYDKCMQRGGR